MPVTLSQSQHLVMLLFSDAIAARKIEPIITARKIAEVIQWFIEAPLVRIFPTHPVDQTNNEEINPRHLSDFIAWCDALMNVALIAHREYQP